MTWPASRCRSDEHAVYSATRKKRSYGEGVGGRRAFTWVSGGVAVEPVGTGGQGERGGQGNGVPDSDWREERRRVCATDAWGESGCLRG